MAEGFKKVPVMAWGFQNLFFVGANPKKNVPVMAWDVQNFFFGYQPKKMCELWHVHFKTLFFGGVPTQKIGASYIPLWH